MELETIIFEIISNAGTAKGIVYEAIQASTEGDFQKAKELLKEADEYLIKAHQVQTDIIHKEAQGDHLEVKVLFVHAQDHLMTAIEVRSLAESLIAMNEKIHELKK